MHALLQAVHQKQAAIYDWLAQYEGSKELPLYSSVDIRDAQFKIAAVDTNLFPAGFNNLCEHGIADSITAVRQAILDRITGCRSVLIIAEEHTRNTWYLEHLRVLHHIIAAAGFEAKVATFLQVQSPRCDEATAVELETAAGHPIKVYSITRVLKDICAGGMRPCFVILNNDLSTGIPDALKDLDVPIYPSIRAGWHSRLKSHHFQHLADLIQEGASLLGVDPWLLTCVRDVVDAVDLRTPKDCQRLADSATDMMRRIQTKYDEHGITEKPFVFLKADRGTYGMGVMAVEDPQQLLTLSSRQRNKLYKSKGSQVVDRFLLQEGVPSARRVEGHVGEVCIYQIANQFVGGFYRIHAEKTARENLNSRGMQFKTMCPHSSRYGRCDVQADTTMFDVYRIVARMAGIAAHREIVHLEALAH